MSTKSLRHFEQLKEMKIDLKNSTNSLFNFVWEKNFSKFLLKTWDTLMQIEKRLINDRSHVSKLSGKFCIQNIYNFVVIYRWKLLFLWKVAYFLRVSIVLSVYKQIFTPQ